MQVYNIRNLWHEVRLWFGGLSGTITRVIATLTKIQGQIVVSTPLQNLGDSVLTYTLTDQQRTRKRTVRKAGMHYKPNALDVLAQRQVA